MGRNKKTKNNNLHQGEKEIMVTIIPLSSKKKLILDTLYRKDIAMTPNAIAKATGFAYVTVRKYIAEMIDDTILIEHWIKKQKRKYKPMNKAESRIEKRKRSESKRYTINPEVFNK